MLTFLDSFGPAKMQTPHTFDTKGIIAVSESPLLYHRPKVCQQSGERDAGVEAHGDYGVRAGPDYPLFGKPAKALALATDMDGVLFEFLDKS
jgi:hypothetical protein